MRTSAETPRYLCLSLQEWLEQGEDAICYLSERAYVRVWRWEAGEGKEPHNADVDLIWLIWEGKVEVTIGEVTHFASAGTLIAIPAGIVRGFRAHSSVLALEIGFHEQETGGPP